MELRAASFLIFPTISIQEKKSARVSFCKILRKTRKRLKELLSEDKLGVYSRTAFQLWGVSNHDCTKCYPFRNFVTLMANEIVTSSH